MSSSVNPVQTQSKSDSENEIEDESSFLRSRYEIQVKPVSAKLSSTIIHWDIPPKRDIGLLLHIHIRFLKSTFLIEF